MYTLTREEQETTINWCRGDKTATIDTADPVEIRKLDKLAEAYPDVYKVLRINPHHNGKMYSVPARYIRFGKPASAARREAARRNSVFCSVDAPIRESEEPPPLPAYDLQG